MAMEKMIKRMGRKGGILIAMEYGFSWACGRWGSVSNVLSGLI